MMSKSPVKTKALIILSLLLLPLCLAAQEEDELPLLINFQAEESAANRDLLDDDFQIKGLDASLFLRAAQDEADEFGELNKYYRSPVNVKRRGLDWWITRSIFQNEQEAIVLPTLGAYARIFGSTRDYNFGGELVLSKKIGESFIVLDLEGRSGRDLYTQGVFNNILRPNLSFLRGFSNGAFISIDLNANYLQRGEANMASAEVFELTGDYRYNSAWGYYDGKVRNSRVSESFVPRLELRFQSPLAKDTHLALDLNAEYGSRKRSRLGWYDSYTPQADYYRKLPSYFPYGDLRESVTQLWQSEQSAYTQINWDEMISVNQNSLNGEARYVVENQVEKPLELNAKLLMESKLNNNFSLVYGLDYTFENSLNYKELDDLLGADYLLDIDQFTGDYERYGTNMQNNLRDPNRQVAEGERFDYQFRSEVRSLRGVLGFDFKNNRLSAQLRAVFGVESLKRIGDYEKERFAGALSYGESVKVEQANNNISASLIYSLSPRNSLIASANILDIPALSRDVFIQERYANKIVENPQARQISNFSLSYKHFLSNATFAINTFYTTSQNGSDIIFYYDNLSDIYTNAVISEISTRSYGLELTIDCSLTKEFSFGYSLLLGSYTYNGAPLISLYSDQDLELYSISRSSALDGMIVGNAPQMLMMANLNYFVGGGWILSADLSYAAGRYIEPSAVRRTERVLSYLESSYLHGEVVEQEALDDVFDVSLSLTRTLFFSSRRRLSFTLRIDNLLGREEGVEYAREANRLLENSGSASSASMYVQPSSYIYAPPRSFYASVRYTF